ncbi:hypothetical protein RND71_018399 [Anisodus tanguticus]|uniref:C2 NT-type domain-containing protein n=1 Tax=Anisodus tanguticus TaxID=243964 RepID=A0AAE1VAY6_9SOLA|nr:hypothetical protein RND71_018399 [Anisodus tanguticus]
MVSGPRAKTRKGLSVQVDYLVHIQEIKLWSGVGEGRIEFNKSFKLLVTLLKEISIKGGDRDGDAFQKNCIEFNLYEPRRDKTVKCQLLGTAIINLAEYGVVKEGLNPFERSRMSSSSSREVLTREASIDCSCVESVSTLTSEEYAEEAEIASFTDDDGSSHSSVAVSSSANGSNCGSLPQGEGTREPTQNRRVRVGFGIEVLEEGFPLRISFTAACEEAKSHDKLIQRPVTFCGSIFL